MKESVGLLSKMGGMYGMCFLWFFKYPVKVGQFSLRKHCFLKQNGDFEGEVGGEPTDRHTYAQRPGVGRRGRGREREERRGREERINRL